MGNRTLTTGYGEPIEVVSVEFIMKKISNDDSLDVIQSHDLYLHYKHIKLQVENFCLKNPHSKCPSIVNIYQPNKIRLIRKIGYYQGDLCVILFEDQMLCLMFEHSNGAYSESLRNLNLWRSYGDKNGLRLTTIDALDYRGIFWVTTVSLETHV